MNKKPLIILLVSAFCLAVSGLAISRRTVNVSYTSLAETTAPEPPALEDIQGYKNWVRVNDSPIILPPKIAALCRLASPEEVAAEKNNPHRQKYLTVYVNEIGSHAMLEAKTPIFAIGSIIVKEKLPSKTSESPELLTVMIKREAGYSSAHGDWEYLVLDGKASKIEARGQMANCMSCHESEKDTDYVFRTYRPDDLHQKLR
jgi:hypothetical protein